MRKISALPRPFPKRRLGKKPEDLGQAAKAALGSVDATAHPASVGIVSVASILTGHVLRDGELVILMLKPSRWYLFLNTLPFAALVSLCLCALQLSRVPHAHMRYYVDAGIFAISGRMMWAVLKWMGLLYVLTDQRVLRISGIFQVDVFDCPLRKLARTRVVRNPAERVLRVGSIELTPLDESRPGTTWQTIRHTQQVHAQIEATIRRAMQNGF